MLMEAEAEAEAFEPTEAPAPAPAGELHSREWPLAPILSRRPPLAPGAANSASEEEAAAEEAAADAADKEWVREELSDAQLEARAAAVGRRYEGKLLPAAGEELVTSMAQCWLVSVLCASPPRTALRPCRARTGNRRCRCPLILCASCSCRVSSPYAKASRSGRG